MEAGKRGRRGRAKGGDTRGVVVVEYALLLVMVMVPVVLATGALGAALIKSYVETRDNILHEGP